MTTPNEPLRAFRERVRLRVVEARRQLTASVRLTRGTLTATRKMLIGVGLIEEKKPEKRARYIPSDAFWIVWWLLFIVGFILPTYAAEPYVVFPSVLALAVVWLFGMAQFTHTLLGTDLRDVKLTPDGWKVLVQSYRDAGIPLPQEAMTDESAQAASKELEGPLPGMARQSVLDLTALAAVQAVLAGFIAMVGLLVGPSLTNVHWWHGWSPVSILYAASLPTGLSLLGYGLVPFIVSRFLAALRLRSETSTATTNEAPAPGAPAVTTTDTTAPVAANAATKRRRRPKQLPSSTDSA